MTEESRKSLSNSVTTTAIVTCVFFYFLIFAQFGFIHRLAELNPPAFLNEMALFGMGLGGISGCIVAARKFNARHTKAWLMSGFIGCGLAATTVAAVPGIWLVMGAALAVGLFLGLLTVVVVPVISRTLPGHRLGLFTSLGVGTAYGISNIPFIFNLSPQDHCICGGVACVAGVVLTNFLPSLESTKSDMGNEVYRTPTCLYARTGIISLVALFLALIWLDSAAFYVIQETISLKNATWSTDHQLWILASIHFLAAVLTGWCLDRGWVFQIVIIALAVLMIGAWQISHFSNETGPWQAFLYVGAVSMYSVSLVAYGALRPEMNHTLRVQSRAALVFAIAGWFGSGMGIGMARDLHTVPTAFFIAALGVAAISIAVSLFASSHESALLKKARVK
jgi:MFS family permease